MANRYPRSLSSVIMPMCVQEPSKLQTRSPTFGRACREPIHAIKFMLQINGFEAMTDVHYHSPPQLRQPHMPILIFPLSPLTLRYYMPVPHPPVYMNSQYFSNLCITQDAITSKKLKPKVN